MTSQSITKTNDDIGIPTEADVRRVRIQAAAEDLYAALEKFMELSDSPDRYARADAARQAYTALAKARGE